MRFHSVFLALALAAALALPVAAGERAVFLIVDEDTINNSINLSDTGGLGSQSIVEYAFAGCCGNGDPSVCVNDNIASIPDISPSGGCDEVLKINLPPQQPSCSQILWLPTGQTGDEGLFSPFPNSFDQAPGGIASFLYCPPGPDPPNQPESYLDPIAGYPLTQSQIQSLEGRTVCAVAKGSDVSNLGSNQLNLQGDRLGRTAFRVLDVLPHPEGGSNLPVMQVVLLDVDQVCGGNVDTVIGQPLLETLDAEPMEMVAGPVSSEFGSAGPPGIASEKTTTFILKETTDDNN